MRAIEKSAMFQKMLLGEVQCDCSAPATRIDSAGRPECQRCHELNELAEKHHQRYDKMVRLNWVDELMLS